MEPGVVGGRDPAVAKNEEGRSIQTGLTDQPQELVIQQVWLLEESGENQ